MNWPWLRLPVLGLAAYLAALPLGAFAQIVQPLDSVASRIIILPFQNLSQEPEARKAVMPRLYREVEQRGLRPVPEDSVEAALRRFRIRDTGQLSSDHALKLSTDQGARLILLGAIDLYSRELLQAGLSARLLNGPTAEIFWADSRFAAGNAVVSLLQPNPPDSLELLMQEVLQDLLLSFEQAWRKHQSNPGGTFSPDAPRARVFIIPWENSTGSLSADQIVNHVAMSVLYQQGFGVIEPGLINEQTRSRGLMPKGQLNAATLKELADRFAAAYCLTGTLIQNDVAAYSENGNLPVIELNLRLIDARSARQIGSDHIFGSGADYIKIFQWGAIRSPGQLLERLLRRSLTTMSRLMTMQNN